MECQRFQELLPKYLAEELAAEERQAWRSHFLECTGCRTSVLAREPALLFALASRREAPTAKVEACAEYVTASIRRDRLAGRIRGKRRPWLAAAAAALVAVGGGLAWQQVNHREAGAPQAAVLGVAEHRAPEVDVENEGENVRVYQLASDEDTTVTFVVDPAMEL